MLCSTKSQSKIGLQQTRSCLTSQGLAQTLSRFSLEKLDKLSSGSPTSNLRSDQKHSTCHCKCGTCGISFPSEKRTLNSWTKLKNVAITLAFSRAKSQLPKIEENTLFSRATRTKSNKRLVFWLCDFNHPKGFQKGLLDRTIANAPAVSSTPPVPRTWRKFKRAFKRTEDWRWRAL